MDKQLKVKITANIVILVSLVFLQISMAFAWFSLDNELTIDQEIVLGRFYVKVNENSDYTVYTGSDISVNAAYPMTRETAETSGGNLLMFKVQNNGNISAMIRFKLDFSENGDIIGGNTVNGENYLQYFKFSAYTLMTENSEAVFAAEGDLLNFDTVMDGITCENNSYTEYGKIDGRKTSGGLDVAGQHRLLKVFVWLDHNVVLGSGGTGGSTGLGNENIFIAFRLNVEAMQSTGGVWS